MIANDDSNQKATTPQDISQQTQQEKKQGGSAYEPVRAGHQINVNDLERLISIVAGASLLFLVRRRLYFVLSIAAAGVYLLYRGTGGHCMIYESLGIDTAGQDWAGAQGGATERPDSQQVAGRPVAASGEEDTGPNGHIEEMIRESFPASDPPATW